MRFLQSIVLMVAVSCLPVAVAAEAAGSPEVTASGDLITARHRYRMGDNDTKSDAGAICFLEAKRKAVEYAGTYVESSTQMTRTDVSSDGRTDIRSIAGALVSAELVSSTAGFANDAMFIDCEVNARVDRANLQRNIERIVADPAAFRQVEEQQRRMKGLEADIARLQADLRSASRQEAITLRQERAVVFKEIDTLLKKKQEIVAVIEKSGRDAARLVVKKMTREEVRTLLGEPRAEQQGNLNYGTQWVIFDKSSLVACVSDRPMHHLNCR